MQLLSTLFTLATASLIAAAPATVEQLKPNTVERLKTDTVEQLKPNKLPPGITWQVNGYGNPNCEGPIVWTEKGASPGIRDHDCRATKGLAASYGVLVTEITHIRTWADPVACVRLDTQLGRNPLERTVTADAVRHVEYCVTTAVYALGIAQGDKLFEEISIY